jgi:integrase
VPISPEVIELGLKQFVDRRERISRGGRVFREFRTGTKGRTSDGLTKFWASYLRKFGLWKPGRSTHVFRHTVVACLRGNDASEEDIAALVGHTRGSVTAQYGGAYPLSRKLRTVNRLNYGFDLVAAVGGAYSINSHA